MTSNEWNKINKDKCKIANLKWCKSVEDKHGIGINTITRYGVELAVEIYDKYDRKCYVCGSEENLSIHHIDGKGRNYENRGLKPNNSLNNLQLLCVSCHSSISGKYGSMVRWKSHIKDSIFIKKEKIKRYKKEYQIKNKEMIKAKKKEYYLRNKEIVNQEEERRYQIFMAGTR